MMRSFPDMLPKGFGRMVAGGGLVIYVIGSIVAIFLGAPVLFQRFGSIGVAAAILFFDDRLLQVELKRQASVERILREYGLELEVLKEGIDPRSMPKHGYVIDYLREEARLKALREHAARINSVNIFLLSIATLQWGFGDVFLKWVMP